MRCAKSLILGFFILTITGLSHAEERKVVYDLTSGDAEKIESRLLNGIKFVTDYYKKHDVDFKVVVVISGKSYKYFIEDLENSPYKDEKDLLEVQKKFRPLLQELNDEYGVRFDMCGAGMKAETSRQSRSIHSCIRTRLNLST